MNEVFIHEIKLPETDEFSKRFNECSDYWRRSQDQSLSEKERNESYEIWLMKRQCLELGIGG